MKKLTWRGGALLAPLCPALVTCGSMEKPNVLTVAWTGIVNTIPPKTYISIRPERYSYGLIEESGEFVINLPTKSMLRAVDFCGVRSGREIDKFTATGLTPMPSGLSCPLIDESPLCLECRVTNKMALGSHTMFLADIAATRVNTELVDRQGKLHLDRCGLAAFAHGEYFSLGEKLGSFGFSVKKAKKKGRK